MAEIPADRFKAYAPDVHAVVRLEEALPPDRVHVFVDLVRSIDLGHFVIPPGPKGEKPYHPHALFGILAWGYLHGVRSSRRLAQLARQEATFAYLAGGGRPDYRTLARFRRANAAAFTAVFQETVVLALRLGLAKLGHVALDGTKLRANTSKHKAMSYGRMQQREAELKAEIARLVAQAEDQDTADDQLYGDADGFAVDDELARREQRLAKIQALRNRLEAEKRVEQGLADDAHPVIDPKEQRSFADGDARIMLLKRGEYAYAYNGQVVVDEADGIIVEADLTNVASDMPHLPALVQQVRALRGSDAPNGDPTTVSADAGYFSDANAAEDGAGLDLLIAAGRADPAPRALAQGTDETDRTVFTVEAFGYDAAHDVWRCPAHQELTLLTHPPGRRGRPFRHRYGADPAVCAACPLRARCLTPAQDRREVEAWGRRAAGAMRFKLRQPDARHRYARRKVIAEPVFGQIKEDRGFTTLGLRGLVLAKAEFLLACLAHNLGKLLRVCPLPTARPVAPVHTAVVG